jgi:hypothetical protein
MSVTKVRMLTTSPNPAPLVGQDALEQREHPVRLAFPVTDGDDGTVVVERHLAGDEEQGAGADVDPRRVGVPATGRRGHGVGIDRGDHGGTFRRGAASGLQGPGAAHGTDAPAMRPAMGFGAGGLAAASRLIDLLTAGAS